jgi:hypothetical protein
MATHAVRNFVDEHGQRFWASLVRLGLAEIPRQP